jgi:hypothetical protein
VGVLWVYANYLAAGSYQVTGGGAYDAVNNTYAQGSYDADDISRAAVGTASTWPYGAILPSVTSRSQWHPWAAQMPTALADAATALHQPGLLSAAVADAAIFTPHLLTATGPDNLWGPVPVDSSQIAYGGGARVLALLAVATATRSAGLRQLAGIAAGWFFGQNPAGVATYDPRIGHIDTGRPPI